MKKYLIPIGLVWVGLSMVLGLVVVLKGAPVAPTIMLEKEVAKSNSTAKPNDGQDLQKLQAQVHVDGTPGEISDNETEVFAEVEVK